MKRPSVLYCREYGLASSVFTNDINTAARCCHELEFGETYVNRFHFEAIQGFHAGVKKSGIGGADGKHGVEEYLSTHVTYLQGSITPGIQADFSAILYAGTGFAVPEICI